MKDKIIKFLEDIAPRWRTRKIMSHPEYTLALNEMYPGVELNMQIISLLSGESPYCMNCNAPVKTVGKKTCSTKCREVIHKKNNHHSKRIEKQKKTLLELYGVDTVAHIPEIQDKRKSTMLKKYGALVSPHARERTRERAADLNTKGRKSLKERYGVDNPGQIPGHADKIKNTYRKTYGVNHYTQTEEYKIKTHSRREEKYEKYMPAGIRFVELTDDVEKNIRFDNPNQIVSFFCDICNSQENLPSETFKWRIRNTGTPCSTCSGINKGSLKEKEVRDFVTSLGFDVIENTRILDGLEIDIFIPELATGIEFNGLFWHNDTRLDKKYHINKLDIATGKGIRLIQIFEDEWDHKKDIVKSRLSHILGRVEETVYARRCKIKEITHKDEREFLDNNHIQGYVRSSVKVGLYLDSRLISLMTFSKPNKAKGQIKEDGTWELLRFCSRRDVNVVGAAGKLLSYFEKTYDPLKIISFADKRWSTGDLYHTLGFEELNDTRINYWYIDMKTGERMHRFGMRKNSKDDQSLTEYENRLQDGWLRIWDCGNKKFVKTYQ